MNELRFCDDLTTGGSAYASGAGKDQQFRQEYKGQTTNYHVIQALTLGTFGLMTVWCFVLFFQWLVCLIDFFYLLMFEFLSWPLVTFLEVRFGACSS